MAVPPDIPLWLLCPYDTTALDRTVLAEAHRSHPVIVESDIYRGSTEYGGAVHVEKLFGTRLPPPPGATTVHHPRPPPRTGTSSRYSDAATGAGLPVDRSTRLAVAIDEIAHAADQNTGHVASVSGTTRPPWSVEITDPRQFTDPMIGRGPGRTPIHTQGPRHPARQRAVRPRPDQIRPHRHHHPHPHLALTRQPARGGTRLADRRKAMPHWDFNVRPFVGWTSGPFPIAGTAGAGLHFRTARIRSAVHLRLPAARGSGRTRRRPARDPGHRCLGRSCPRPGRSGAA